MKRIKQFSIWIIALLAMTVTNYAWAADTQKPTAGKYIFIGSTNKSIELSWSVGSDNVTSYNKLKYRVYYKEISTGISDASDFLTNKTEYSISGLKANSEYEVTILVFDEANNYATYGGRRIKTKVSLDRKAPVLDQFYQYGNYPEKIIMKWNDATDDVTPPDKMRYTVKYQKTGTSTASYAIVKTPVKGCTIVGLEPGVNYTVTLIAYDEAGNNSVSKQRKITTSPDNVDPKPGTYSSITSTKNSITVNWTKGSDNRSPDDQLWYKVWWKKTSDEGWSTSELMRNTTSYTITGLQPDTEYVVEVEVYDEAENDASYGKRTIKTEQATTPAVSVMRVTLNRNTFTINADYSIVQLTATVYPSNASNKSLTWASSDPTIVSVDSKGLVTIHKKGKARVTATANDGSRQSDTCVFDVIRTVANETVDGLRVYAHGGALYLTLPAAQTVHIYNVQGALVKTLSLPAGDHVQPLTEGMYLVRVGEQVTKVMVK